MTKKRMLGLAFNAFVLCIMAGCNGKSQNNTGDANKSKLHDYPVVEISVGLSNAVKYYSSVEGFENGLAIVKDGWNKGVIDLNGKEVVPCKYTGIERVGKAFFVYEEDGWGHTKCGVLNSSGQEIIPCQFVSQDVHLFPDAEAVVISNPYPDKFIFVDFDGNPLSGMSVDYMRNSIDFTDDYAYVPYRTVIDTKGNIIFHKEYENDLACLVDKNGNEIIPPKYSNINDYDKGLFMTYNNGYYGLWDIKNKKEIVPPNTYDYIATKEDRSGYKHFVQDGAIEVKIRSKYGVIAMDGSEILHPQFEMVRFEEGLIVAKRGGREESEGVYDFQGHEILPCKYSRVMVGKNSIVARSSEEVNNDNPSYFFADFCLFDRNGNKLFNSGKHFANIGLLCEGLSAVKKANKELYGYCDEDGEVYIDFKYDYAGDFSEGLAPVMKDGVCGYVNHAGQDTF